MLRECACIIKINCLTKNKHVIVLVLQLIFRDLVNIV